MDRVRYPPVRKNMNRYQPGTFKNRPGTRSAFYNWFGYPFSTVREGSVFPSFSVFRVFLNSATPSQKEISSSYICNLLPTRDKLQKLASDPKIIIEHNTVINTLKLTNYIKLGIKADRKSIRSTNIQNPPNTLIFFMHSALLGCCKHEY